jgi:Tol biopolymer transport system component
MEIVMLDRSTGREELLVSNRWNDYNPSWSPSGSAFCWQSEEFGHYESRVLVMEVTTRRVRVLTGGVPGRNSDCRWTPDGRGVVVRSNRGDGIPRPWLYPSQGGEATPLSRHSWPVEPRGFLPRTSEAGTEEEGVRAGPEMRPSLQPR